MSKLSTAKRWEKSFTPAEIKKRENYWNELVEAAKTDKTIKLK